MAPSVGLAEMVLVGADGLSEIVCVVMMDGSADPFSLAHQTAIIIVKVTHSKTYLIIEGFVIIAGQKKSALRNCSENARAS